MPSPKSPITQLFDLLRATTALKGVRLQLGAKQLATQGSPPRILLFPVEGPVGNPQDKATALREADRQFAARCWGKDFDEAHDLETKLVQGLAEQATQASSFYWKTQAETWNTDPDSNRQGEEVELLFSVPQALEAATTGTGTIEAVSLLPETKLSADITNADVSAMVDDMAPYPASGVLFFVDTGEKASYAAISGRTFTGLARGLSGTTASSHTAGAIVRVTAT